MNNSHADHDSEFVERSRRAFAASVASLDEAIALRLRQARQRALAEAGRRQPVWRAHPWALPVGAAAVVCAAVIGSLVYSNQDQQMAVPFAAASNNDMAIVLSTDNLDMYADMDFYRWLQAQQQNQNQPAQEPPGNDDNG
ncbi:MAG TPA: hypothetical protein VFL15_06450 [Gammaproteobacteria bacterium]|nr:hypothetical protein [Gammaproteobacteria bacterium]